MLPTSVATLRFDSGTERTLRRHLRGSIRCGGCETRIAAWPVTTARQSTSWSSQNWPCTRMTLDHSWCPLPGSTGASSFSAWCITLSRGWRGHRSSTLASGLFQSGLKLVVSSCDAVEQGKLHLTADEMLLTPPPVGFRPAQWLVEYTWSSNSDHRPLTITASVCYDATDLTLAADLRSRSDLYIICALNRDVGTFDRMSEALHYHMYQGVLLVNNGQFGGSSFFMPFDKPFHRQVFHFHGQPQVAIAFAEVSPEKLVNRPKPNTVAGGSLTGASSDSAPPEGTWKTPPAGWVSREPPI